MIAVRAGEAPGRTLPRLLALALVLGGCALAARACGVPATIEGVSRLIRQLGAPGFILVFALGELAHVPGLVFVAAAVAAWGPIEGGLVSGLGSLISLSFGFLVVRATGGAPLRQIRARFVRGALERLDRHPVLVVALLRLVFVVSPPLSHSLALSGVRFRDYFIGSAIGIAPPLALSVFAFSRVLPR
ncbi:MAG TPA: VTT domain-containing protein [Planctomycetota bacterium]|nr:VTT domain-containing protein [Planctomycetota bacterium]